MIRKNIFEWYSIDTNKDLQIKKLCPRPYDTLLIDKLGDCYACECSSWLPQPVGNLHLQDFTEILSSKVRKELQESVTDGTYRYCNEHRCAAIKNNEFDVNFDLTKLKSIRLAIDDSCNLQCPSCRTKKIFYHKGKIFKRRMSMAKKILSYLHSIEHPLTVTIGSDGDPFASLVYRHVLKNLPARENLNLNLQTNGLLLKKFMERNTHLFGNLDTLHISVDGATKSTYEKLRIGGKWENLIRSLEYVSGIKEKFKVCLHMVVQNDNYKEMTQLLELSNSLNFDEVFFAPIEDWNTGMDFSTQNFWDKKDFLDELDRVKKHKCVRSYHWARLVRD